MTPESQDLNPGKDDGNFMNAAVLMPDVNAAALVSEVMMPSFPMSEEKYIIITMPRDSASCFNSLRRSQLFVMGMLISRKMM